MKVHSVKTAAYSGSEFADFYAPARTLYNRIKGATKRQPYVRSDYFKREKVFLELFWIHLNQKNYKERKKRLRYFGSGIELLRDTKQEPVTKENPNKSRELLHRFAGITPSGDLFFVQVKEDTKTRRKDLMSIFPEE